MDSDKLEVVQGVVDRVSAYQDGAPEGTVERELLGGLEEAGVSLDEDQVRALVSAIEDAPDRVSAAELLS